MYTPLKINVGQFCISFVGYVRFFGFFFDILMIFILYLESSFPKHPVIFSDDDWGV